MKKLSILIFILLLPVSLPGHAEASGPDYWQIANVAENDVLNIHADPDSDAEKIGTIPAGSDCIRNMGCQGGLSFNEFMTLSEEEKAAVNKARPRWCQIEYRGVRGWVSGDYLAEGNCDETLTEK